MRSRRRSQASARWSAVTQLSRSCVQTVRNCHPLATPRPPRDVPGPRTRGLGARVTGKDAPAPPTGATWHAQPVTSSAVSVLTRRRNAVDAHLAALAAKLQAAVTEIRAELATQLALLPSQARRSACLTLASLVAALPTHTPPRPPCPLLSYVLCR